MNDATISHPSLFVVFAAGLLVALEACSQSQALKPVLHAADPFSLVIFHHCYDGDTCTVTLPGLPDVFGDRIPIRLVGIDAPEIRGHCEREKRLAVQARDLLNYELKQASTIQIRHTARDKYFRVLAEIFADGQDVSEILIRRGLAVPYHGGTKSKDWCAEGP